MPFIQSDFINAFATYVPSPLGLDVCCYRLFILHLQRILRCYPLLSLHSPEWCVPRRSRQPQPGELSLESMQSGRYSREPVRSPSPASRNGRYNPIAQLAPLPPRVTRDRTRKKSKSFNSGDDDDLQEGLRVWEMRVVHIDEARLYNIR